MKVTKKILLLTAISALCFTGTSVKAATNSRREDQMSSAAVYASKLLGRPYLWGAAGPECFDCSGLTMYVYSKLGVNLPHSTGSQFSMGVPIEKSNLSPGDLVFFNTYSSVSHVGIYIGNGNFVHAPRKGSSVSVANINDNYYFKSYAGARRVLR